MKKLIFTVIISFLLISRGIAQVTVTLPDLVYSSPVGTIIEIPVSCGTLTSLDSVIAYQFKITFDNVVLVPESPYYDTIGTLSSKNGWIVMANPGVLNEVSIGACGSGALTGSGSLVKLIFKIVSANGSTPLGLNSFYFNAGNPQVILVNGSFTILSCIPQQQYLLIPPGWSGISSYLTPVNSNMVTMFAPVVNNLIMVTDYAFSNQYSPPNSILPTENWDSSQGYFIKMNTETVFVLSGCETADKTIALAAGWNLVPVISNCVYFAEEIMVGLDFEIVQVVAGFETYWPAQSIQTLYFMEPGKAYLIRMNSPGSLTFQECK